MARKHLSEDRAPQLATGLVAAGATQVYRHWSVVVSIVFASRWFTSYPNITFCVPAGVNVSDMKILLEARVGIPAKDQRWFFGANELENHLVVGPTGINEPDRPWFLGESGFRVATVVLDQSWNYKLVLAMGTHICLGVDSPLRILDTDCLQIICNTLDLDNRPRPDSHDAFAENFDCDGGGGGDDANKDADTAADDAALPASAPLPATPPPAPAAAPAPTSSSAATASIQVATSKEENTTSEPSPSEASYTTTMKEDKNANIDSGFQTKSPDASSDASAGSIKLDGACSSGSACPVAAEQAEPDGVNGALNVMDLTVDENGGGKENRNQVGLTKTNKGHIQNMDQMEERRRRCRVQLEINNLIFRTAVGTHNASNGNELRSDEDEVHNTTHGISRQGVWLGLAGRLPKSKQATRVRSGLPLATATSWGQRSLLTMQTRTVLKGRRGLSRNGPDTPWTISRALASNSKHNLDQADTSTTISVDRLREVLPEGAKLTAGPACGMARLRITSASAAASCHVKETDADEIMAKMAKGANASPANRSSAHCEAPIFAAPEAVDAACTVTADATAAPLEQRSMGQSDDGPADCHSVGDAKEDCHDQFWLDICRQMRPGPCDVQVTFVSLPSLHIGMFF